MHKIIYLTKVYLPILLVIIFAITFGKISESSGSAGTNLAMVFLKSAKDTRDCSFSPSECRTVVSKNLYYRLFDLLLTFYADYFIHYSYNY